MRHSLKGQERERSTKYSLLKIAIPQLLTLTKILPLALSIRFFTFRRFQNDNFKTKK